MLTAVGLLGDRAERIGPRRDGPLQRGRRVDACSELGDTLTFFVYLHSLDEAPIGIDTYHRTCAR